MLECVATRLISGTAPGGKTIELLSINPHPPAHRHPSVPPATPPRCLHSPHTGADLRVCVCDMSGCGSVWAIRSESTAQEHLASTSRFLSFLCARYFARERVPAQDALASPCITRRTCITLHHKTHLHYLAQCSIPLCTYIPSLYSPPPPPLPPPPLLSFSLSLFCPPPLTRSLSVSLSLSLSLCLSCALGPEVGM